MLQSMGLQRVVHNSATELNYKKEDPKFKFSYDLSVDSNDYLRTSGESFRLKGDQSSQYKRKSVLNIWKD